MCACCRPQIFCALTAIDAGFLGADNASSLRRPGIKVLLAGEAGTQNEWITSSALELEPHVAAHGNVDFVGGLESQGRIRADILEAPPPLQAAHPDRQIVLAGDAEAARGKKAYDGERADDHDGDDDGAGDRDGHVPLAASLRWCRPAFPPVPQSPDQRDHHQHPDEGADRNDQKDEMLQADRRGAVNVERGLPIAAARGQRNGKHCAQTGLAQRADHGVGP